MLPGEPHVPRARRRVRLRLEAIRRLANAATDGRFAADLEGDFEVGPARHRRNALWQY